MYSIDLALPVWGEGVWPSQPWSGYRLPDSNRALLPQRVMVW